MNSRQMYEALLKKDIRFEGLFYAAILTTGIFCRPTCTARKPKPENVEYYKTSKEAILKGFRPCKICQPLIKRGETPDFISTILKKINNNKFLKVKDWDLIEMGIEPSKVRRWFLKNHGITFHAYQRLSRLNSAFLKIKNGDSISSVAFESGYDSLSGFTETFKNIYGASPSNSNKINVINMTRIETPIGTMIACAVEKGLCLLEFSDRKMLETQLKNISKRLNANIVQSPNPIFDSLKKELDEYFDGKRQIFNIPIYFPGTDFQEKVWQELLDIPYGETRSYKEQAENINNLAAIRAVAHANGMNKISIIIPCHRVIGSDGSLTGYGGGLERKKWLLDHEKKYFKS